MANLATGTADSSDGLSVVDGGLMRKVFYVFAGLALLSIAISVGGKFLGQSIAQGGHTDSTKMREIVIGNNVLMAPENMIRFADSRRDGVTSRLDLYVHWPEFTGYTAATRADFNHANGSKRLLFLTFQEKSMSRDMSGRFAPIYSSLVQRPGKPGPSGLTLYGFQPKSGYLDEMLAVSDETAKSPFVARCLTGQAETSSLAPCERDIDIGDDLSLTIRFPADVLPEWVKLEALVREHARAMLRTG